MLTATKTVKTAVRAMKLGAFDYVTKPFDIDELLVLVERAAQSSALLQEVSALRHEVGQRYSFDNVIGRSPAMQAVLDTVTRVAPLRTTVLLTGESGTGKEVIAKAIHYNSPRANGPLVAINCAAIPENLLESELFGHERGAFTDAHARKLGQFESAHSGTIFLDEIGEMNPATQAKLLRVLETGHVHPRRRLAAGHRRRARRRRHQPRPRQEHGRTAASGPISTSASTSSRSTCRRCATGARICRCSSAISCSARAPSSACRRSASRARRPTACCATAGRATCASSRTSSSAPWRCRSGAS